MFTCLPRLSRIVKSGYERHDRKMNERKMKYGVV
jgi:hypothetical protein